jgi:hypothetical protein
MTHTLNLVRDQQITPERFFNAINSYQITEAIKSAVELEIFTAVSEGNTTSTTIAKRCDATERGVRILCDFLTIHNFLAKQGTSYSLSADSARFLDRHSPAYVGSAIEFLLTPRLRECHAHLTEAVRRGGTALGEGMLDPENPDWVKYARGMMPMARRPAAVVAHKNGRADESALVSVGQYASSLVPLPSYYFIYPILAHEYLFHIRSCRRSETNTEAVADVTAAGERLCVLADRMSGGVPRVLERRFSGDRLSLPVEELPLRVDVQPAAGPIVLIALECRRSHASTRSHWLQFAELFRSGYSAGCARSVRR